MSIVAAILLCSVAVWIAGTTAFDMAAKQAFARGRLEADRYAALLTTEFHRFDFLPELLALHPSVQNVLRDPADKAIVDAANRYLASVNASAGASNLYMMDTNGRTIATSNWSEPTSYLGADFSFRPYFQNALRKGEDRFYGIGAVSSVPGYFFAKALSRDGATLGIAVVKVNLENLGIYRSSSIREFMIVDENGVIVLSSRADFKYRTMTTIAPDVLATMAAARQYSNVALTPIGLVTEDRFGDGSVVSLPSESTGTGRARFLAQSVAFGTSNWTIVVLSDLSDVTSFKHSAQTVTALVSTTLLFFALFVMQRQRAIQLQLAAKQVLARANSELESQVQQRTQALVDTNQRLRESQEIVVHSAKLAAIGQLAAGVTHELNQPLAAIRMLSENAGVFIQRTQTDQARENLSAVVDLVDRINGLIGELKTFSRKGSNSLQPLSVETSIDNSLQILAPKTRNTDVTIVWHPAGASLWVMADPPRLDQVFINLLSNAIDAVVGVEHPMVEIRADVRNEWVEVTIGDNGTGLSPDVLAHLFEPFFTTKDAGAGLGLGLAISIGIVRDFGGSITAVNRTLAGALFTVRLPAGGSAGGLTR